MNAITALAETFNFVFLRLYTLLLQFLQINFTLVSSFIASFEIVKENVLQNIFSILYALQCCYQDFVLFIHEVISIIVFVIDISSDFLYNIYLKLNFILLTFLEVVYLLHENAELFLESARSFVLNIVENFIYVVELVFSSALLLIQLGPNILIFLYETIVYAVCYLSTATTCFVVTLLEQMYYILYRTGETIYNIPVKAYFGLFLIMAVYYQYHILLFFLTACRNRLQLVLDSSQAPIRYIKTFCLKPVKNIIMYVPQMLICLFYTEEGDDDTDVVHEASTSNFNVTTKKNSFKRHAFFPKIFSRYFVQHNYLEEELIQQLQNELVAEREKHLCIICCENPRSIIFHPCRHMCVCDKCSVNLSRCPICRRHVLEDIHVFT